MGRKAIRTLTEPSAQRRTPGKAEAIQVKAVEFGSGGSWKRNTVHRFGLVRTTAAMIAV